MKSIDGIGLKQVQDTYSGPEADLWELVMGEQIHIGGLASSRDLAGRAGIAGATRGVDLCCCTGAGMRFLVRFCNIRHMTGVDATEREIKLGEKRNAEEGMSGSISFVLGDASKTDLPASHVDFVWGEDAWCYVVDKPALIAEAVRLVKPGGTIAFTDWLEGPTPMTDAEAQRFLRFMKFPSIQDLAGYRDLLTKSGATVAVAADTGRFAPCIDLYLAMLSQQLTYDALKIIGFDTNMMSTLGEEMQFAASLAKQGKLIQGLFVARKNK